jgi:hypothetical protein
MMGKAEQAEAIRKNILITVKRFSRKRAPGLPEEA